ncbi:MAG: TIGR00730 family Rossman fold protein [Acidobacteria bacterium]|nr:TIGR00730 family Rossman fold protein [Acidobacteriota bacterium]
MFRVCVFCGSGFGRNPAYRTAAGEVGRLIAARGGGLVYGGSHLGLMGVVADAAAAGGAPVTGVMPEVLVQKEAAHTSLADLRITASMHERKAAMADMADAFLALPGGIGTLDELCEIIAWAQLGIHSKPIGLLDVDGYWEPFRALLGHAIAEGFIKEKHRDLVRYDSDPGRLLSGLGLRA